MPILTQQNLTYEDALHMIVEDHKYEPIRLEEPDLFDMKSLPILKYAMPTFDKKTELRRTRSLELDKHHNPDFKLKDYLFSEDWE